MRESNASCYPQSNLCRILQWMCEKATILVSVYEMWNHSIQTLHNTIAVLRFPNLVQYTRLMDLCTYTLKILQQPAAIHTTKRNRVAWIWSKWSSRSFPCVDEYRMAQFDEPEGYAQFQDYTAAAISCCCVNNTQTERHSTTEHSFEQYLQVV